MILKAIFPHMIFAKPQIPIAQMRFVLKLRILIKVCDRDRMMYMRRAVAIYSHLAIHHLYFTL